MERYYKTEKGYFVTDDSIPLTVNRQAVGNTLVAGRGPTIPGDYCSVQEQVYCPSDCTTEIDPKTMPTEWQWKLGYVPPVAVPPVAVPPVAVPPVSVPPVAKRSLIPSEDMPGVKACLMLFYGVLLGLLIAGVIR